MEDAAGDPPFHWQPPTAYRRRRQPSPPLFDSSLAIVLLPCLALLFLFFLLHTFNQKPAQTIQYSYNPQTGQTYPHPIQLPQASPPPKPTAFSFRRGWDSLNVVLIVAAILCGVLARRNDDPPPPIPPEYLVRSVRPDFRTQFPFSGCQQQHHQLQQLQNQQWFQLAENRRNEDPPPIPPENLVRSVQNVRPDYRSQFPFSGCQHQQQHQHQLQSQQWFQMAENRRIYGVSPRRSFGVQPEIGGGRLRRTSSAYPEFMREEASIWEEETRRLRFFDDFGINSVYSSDETSFAPNLEEQVQQPPAVTIDEDRSVDGDEIEIKEVPVDDFAEIKEDSVPEAPASPTMSPAPPPPPPPPPVTRSRTKRTFHSVPRREQVEKSTTEPPPPPPVPPPTTPREPLQQPEKKLRRRKSNTTKEIAMVLASLYGKKKRKHQKKSNRNDRPSSDQTTASEQRFPPPSPPPPLPPPPPPPSVFNFFKKSSKIKKIHSVTSAPLPPPPPPRKSQISLKHPISDPPSRKSTNSRSRRPPLPARRSIHHYEAGNGEESPRINSGSQSPIVQIPAPPPLPPFTIPEMKFSVVGGGEFVRIVSSRAGSPEELEDEGDLTTTSNVEESRPSVESEINGGDLTGPTVTCPSPDVNAKADTFIARHHSGWRLEKINSWREKRMGPGP